MVNSRRIRVGHGGSTLTHGSPFTITGSGFGSKDGTNANKALLFTDWSSDTFLPDSAVSHLTSFGEADSNWRSRGEIWATDTPTGEARAYRYALSNIFGTKYPAVFGVNGQVGNPDKFYIYVKRKYDFGSSPGWPENFKNLRFYYNAGSSTYNNGGVNFGSLVGARKWMNEFDTQEAYINTPPFNTWVATEVEMQKNSSIGTRNGFFDVRFNSTRMGSRTSDWEPVVSQSNQMYDQYWLVITQDNQNSATEWNSYNALYGPVYMDDTRARVVVTNSATYSSSTVIEIQPPTSWSDTSITVRARKGALSSGTNYLYVFKSDGTRVDVGAITVA